MPCTLRFTLSGPPPATPYQHHAGLHRLVLAWLSQVSPRFAAGSHHARKPYTVSPLWPVPEAPGRLHFTIGVLDDAVADMLQAGADRYGPTLGLGPQQYHLEAVTAEDQVGWGALAQAAPVSTTYRVRLLSPTRASEPAGDGKAAPPPSPEAYVASWLAQWNRWCPQALVLDESVVLFAAKAVQLAACRVEAETVPLFRGVFVGYVGECAFQVLEPRRIVPAYLHALAALARFANYCGTGKATAAGMGQTECRPLTL